MEDGGLPHRNVWNHRGGADISLACKLEYLAGQRYLYCSTRSAVDAINARRESVFEKLTFRDAVHKRRCLVSAGGYYEWVSLKGQLIESVAIITCDSAGELATIHSQMPVILHKDRWEFWVDPSVQDADGLRKAMEYSDLYEGLRVYAVSNTVNSVAHDGPELIKPITLGEPRTLF